MPLLIKGSTHIPYVRNGSPFGTLSEPGKSSRCMRTTCSGVIFLTVITRLNRASISRAASRSLEELLLPNQPQRIWHVSSRDPHTFTGLPTAAIPFNTLERHVLWSSPCYSHGTIKTTGGGQPFHSIRNVHLVKLGGIRSAPSSGVCRHFRHAVPERPRQLDHPNDFLRAQRF